MPNMTNVVLKDHADGNHTYKPRGTVNGITTFTESTGVPIGERRMSLATTRTTSGRYKSTMKFVLPVVQNTVINGITKPAVVRTAYIDVTFAFDGGSSSDERADALFALFSALNVPAVTDSIRELEPWF